jgi:hypothetical protein
MLDKKSYDVDVEPIRIPNGNIISGASTFDLGRKDPIYIRYYASTYANALGTIFEKSKYDFYDEDLENSDLVDPKYVQEDVFLEASRRFYRLLGEDTPDDNFLKQRLTSKKSMEVYVKSDRTFEV